MVSIKESAEFLGVVPQTLRRWEPLPYAKQSMSKW
jgi:DNA-binding transcriptional MerR regulator